MTYEEAIEWIHSRLPFGSRPGLERILALLENLKNPQNKIKTIHIGGTNGKGSTVTYLRGMLEGCGLKVGTFTSPYIESFNERISINGQPISNEDLIASVAKIQPIVARLDETEALNGSTEFEIITAMMFEFFYEQEVDIAIIEVGLGGTLDCTNVITPLVVGIVTVGYDHMDILGNSLKEIAQQKAGIIKQDQPVVVGYLPPEAQEVIQAKAIEENSRLYRLGEEFKINYHHPLESWGESFGFENDQLRLKNLEIPLLGVHQTENAGVAIEIFHIFTQIAGLPYAERVIQKGLQQARWPGRMEKIMDEPLVILDGAHNEAAAERLVDNLKREFRGREVYLLFAAITTKDVEKMFSIFKRLPHHQLILTSFDSPKAFSAEKLRSFTSEPVKVSENWQEALVQLLPELSQEDMLVITGSLYFISQVRQVLLKGEIDE